jgi:hypothetical protein
MIHVQSSISDFGLALQRNLEYLELPNQGWNMFHEDDNHEFGLVNIFLPSSKYLGQYHSNLILCLSAVSSQSSSRYPMPFSLMVWILQSNGIKT